MRIGGKTQVEKEKSLVHENDRTNSKSHLPARSEMNARGGFMTKARSICRVKTRGRNHQRWGSKFSAKRITQTRVAITTIWWRSTTPRLGFEQKPAHRLAHKQEGIVSQIECQARFVGVIVEHHRRGRRVETHQLHEPCGECEKPRGKVAKTNGSEIDSNAI